MVVLGIDFGTTNSCMSYYNHSTRSVEVILNDQGDYTTPTCIYFDTNSNDIVFGQPAIEMKGAVTNIKRLVCLKYSSYCQDKYICHFFESRGITVVELNTFCAVKVLYYNTYQILTVESIIKLFIRYLINVAQSKLVEPIEAVVITVPAYFTDLQRQIIKNCVEDTGLSVERILNEPTAAALAYGINDGLKKDKTENVLVIDCGGGTTDVSLLCMDYNEQMFEVITVNGNNFLGGEDLTQNLLHNIADKCKLGADLTSKQLSILQKCCETAKHQLSYTSNTNILLECFKDDKDILINVSREQFLQCNKPFFENIKELVRQTVFGYDVDKTVFVGGSTIIPYFRELCECIITSKICQGINVDHAVSIGAALQGASIMSSESTFTLLDVTTMSFGIEVEGGLVSNVISKNTRIPTSKTRVFTNSDYASDLSINVYQGERKLATDSTLLKSFNLSSLDNTLKCGEMHILVTFTIDVNGMLIVSAKERRSGSETSISIKVEKNFNQEDDALDKYFFEDAEKCNKVVAKNLLKESLQRLKNLFQENKTTFGFTENKNSVRQLELEQLFSSTLDILSNFKDYSSNVLNQHRETLEENFHLLIVNQQNHVLGGSTKIV